MRERQGLLASFHVCQGSSAAFFAQICAPSEGSVLLLSCCFAANSKTSSLEMLLWNRSLFCSPGGVPAKNSRGERLLLYIGIIDILQNYRLLKKMEHTFKSVVHEAVRTLLYVFLCYLFWSVNEALVSDVSRSSLHSSICLPTLSVFR